jgi:hypothetical protein
MGCIFPSTQVVTTSRVNRLRWRVSMHMSEVEGTNMVENHGHSMNHRLGEEGMNTVEEDDNSMNH